MFAYPFNVDNVDIKSKKNSLLKNSPMIILKSFKLWLVKFRINKCTKMKTFGQEKIV
jgi:hypothetical protein